MNFFLIMNIYCTYTYNILYLFFELQKYSDILKLYGKIIEIKICYKS